MKTTFSDIIIAERTMYILFLLLLITTNIMAQQEYKTVKEAKGLPIGETVKDFSAVGLNNSTFILSEALKKGPVVIIFYRGQWCPVCNKHLSNLQDSLQMIYDKGAAVIAISPEKIEHLKETAEKTQASFILLYDEEYKISDLFDVTFKPDNKTTFTYNTFLGADLKNAQSDNSQRLPIPATFIIDKNSQIVWRQFDPDYKNRSTAKDILFNLP